MFCAAAFAAAYVAAHATVYVAAYAVISDGNNRLPPSIETGSELWKSFLDIARAPKEPISNPLLFWSKE